MENIRELFDRIDELHVSGLAAGRIHRNLKIPKREVLTRCREHIYAHGARIYKSDDIWHIEYDNIEFCVRCKDVALVSAKTIR